MLLCFMLAVFYVLSECFEVLVAVFLGRSPKLCLNSRKLFIERVNRTMYRALNYYQCLFGMISFYVVLFAFIHSRHIGVCVCVCKDILIRTRCA